MLPDPLFRDLSWWWVLSPWMLAALILFAASCHPVLAAPLTLSQREMVEEIQTLARQQQGQLATALAEQNKARADLATAQADATAARADVATLRQEKTAAELSRWRAWIFGCPVALAVGVVAGLFLAVCTRAGLFAAGIAAKVATIIP